MLPPIALKIQLLSDWIALPMMMSTSNRIIKPGYESYQPVIAARQLGLGQVPPHFFLHHLTESRADLPDLVTSQE
jgi:hypothetical protein